MSETAGLLLDVSHSAPEASVVRLIARAVDMGASDLFMVSNEQHVAVLVRHLGIIRPLSILTTDQGRRCIAHVRASSGMDVSEKRKPGDGRWIFEADSGATVDLRINALPTLYGEDLAIRLLTRGSQVFGLDALGMTREQLAEFEQMVASPSGLILITGPTGSGKTATLYSALSRLNNGTRKINTIEDPIEYAIDGLRQSQVNPAIGLTFPDLLRGVLRQSPDVIMIGEIRDAETAQTAAHAANSGILVLATLHAPSAAGAVQSMRSLGVHSHFLSTSLLGVVTQRLARTLDPAHRLEFDVTDAPGTFEEVRPLLGPGEGNVLYAPKPDASNYMSGYVGRTGVFEVMRVTRDLRPLIADGKPTREIRDRAVAGGMLPFRHAALLKVARGITSTEELFRVAPAEQMMTEE